MKKKNSEWYKTWFNSSDYLDLYRHRNSADAEKIVRLISRNIKLSPGIKVLDAACGNGRHSILFAKKGCDVLGIDLSEYLISQAKLKLKNEYSRFRNHLKFEIRDMRKINRKGEFDLAVNLFSSFGYFDNDRNNLRVIKSISDSLKKGGCFFFDFMNKNYTQKKLVPFDIKNRKDSFVLQTRHIVNGFIEKDILIMKTSRKKFNIKHFTEKVRLYSLTDFKQMFSKYALEIIKLFGDYTGKAYNKNNSERLIILARKKE